MNKFKKKSSFYIIPVSIITIFLIIYFILNNFFQLKSYDFMIKKTSVNNVPSDKIVLVVIDDKSLSELGRWPWKRTLISEIFEYFENHTKAKIVGFDGIIEDLNFEDKGDDKKFFRDVQKFKKLHFGMFFDNYDYTLSKDEQNEYIEILNLKNKYWMRRKILTKKLVLSKAIN